MNKYQWIFAVTAITLALAIPYLWIDALVLSLAYLFTAFAVFCIVVVSWFFVWLGDKQ